MAKLIYSAITSLDGYVADEDGNFDWAAPDDEVHAFVNDLDLVDTRRFGNGVVHLGYRVTERRSTATPSGARAEEGRRRWSR